MDDLTLTATAIPGLLVLELPVHGDNRGWFKENWQREKMVALGLPDFGPVQNNVSYNEAVGTTRGIHAEPWDKLVSVATGRIFGAWVDLREGESFGTVFTTEVGPGRAVFVPQGVGNAYQTLEERTAYTYLVNDHWSPDASYTFLNLADETAAIAWPVPLDRAELSDKDRAHPRLADVRPVPPRRTLVLGANGQLGRALRELLPEADAWGREDFDVTDPAAYERVDWRRYDTIVNASAYTKVDEAETPQGRRDAWRVNVHGVVELAKVATRHGLTLVQVSSDYVFDGERESHPVDETFSPLGVYGQTKAAGDAVVQTVPRHYVVRTSWVVGDGPNFVATMQRLAEDGVDPAVVDDQVGLLTHTSDLAREIVDLVRERRPYGTYHVTSGGEPRSWFQIARDVFEQAGHDPARVTPTSTEDYGRGKQLAPRPRFSTLE
ncbi:bifunctional dTDP-4-dehydrorhamnose 3,5-epimerase family protein/NAD(P)-dependent oxidoreductase [Aeromicrobium sp. IC_218]|uniref:sugar nucleotide-binding protein n=1 Tax=Aeromicrobium sp. IC_218 TaxID=2545468 RepID=UPI001039CA4D|nr:bifunctional dTDP-4-dehydrorhamnose 3,5-epimerase family protein/NAD(P)-dependent oxidoreductase [Aeromicrobium sp. IC_218]TCJ00676.1 NAD-dependent epimerase/dehydratase family protein [Aeromicrobium sp. IC_218]